MIQIDMDMPKQCISCPLCKHIHLADSPLLIYACGKGMRPIYSHETAEGVDEFCKMQKPEWCPLKEVKHGKWEELRPYDVRCSVCGNSMMDKYPFCPECGSRMEE